MATYLFTTISTLAKPRRTITAVALSSGPWELLAGNTVTGWQNTITIILLYAIITTIVVGKFSVCLVQRNNDRVRSAHTIPGQLPTHSIRTICVSLYLIAYLLPYQLPCIRADTHARG